MPTCTKCGQANPDGFRFCGMCGTPFAAVAPERRKLVTLLFCDLSGSTALGERIDAETTREIMFRYFAAVRDPIERHGGTVEKYVGDAVLAVFGVPDAHEDDALRACRAALDMTERMGQLNGELQARFGLRLALRIGVNTGEVVAGDAAAREAFVSGDAVNTAARLEQLAPADGILLGEVTFRLVRDRVEAESAGQVRAKGKADPLRASMPAWPSGHGQSSTSGSRAGSRGRRDGGPRSSMKSSATTWSGHAATAGSSLHLITMQHAWRNGPRRG